MNRHFCTIISLLVVASLDVNAQTPVFHEDFTNGIPATFSLFDRDGLTPKAALGFPNNTAWAAWTDPDDSDNGIAASVSYYEVSGTAYDWMVLPKVQLPEDAESCQLYWRTRSAYDTYKDGYAIMISERTDLTPEQLIGQDTQWSLLRQVQNNQNPATWTTFQLDLSSYAGKEVYISFINNTPDGWMLFLDDITIGSRESVAKCHLHLTTSKYAENGKATITGTVKAGILDPLSSFKARLTSEGDTLTDNVTLKNYILPNEKTTITLKNKLSGTPATSKLYKVELLDEAHVISADSGSVTFVAALEGTKSIVAEGLINRGQNGGFGPRLIEAYRKATEKYGDTFIGIQVHGPNTSEDDLTAQGLDDYREYLLSNQAQGYGQGVFVDRQLSGEVYSDILSLCSERQSKPLLCTAKVEGTSDDEKIEATAACVFGFPLADVSFGYEWMIVEDEVWSSQWNAYSGGLFGNFKGYENKDLDVSLAFNGVLRYREAGPDMTFAKETAAQDTVRINMTVSRDFPVNEPRNLKAILLITDTETGEILNATSSPLTYTGEQPVSGIATVSSGKEEGMTVYDLTGKVITVNGKEQSTDTLKRGIYIIKKKENGTIKTYKICK